MKELLRKLYEHDRLTAREIAQMLDMSARTVSRRLHEYGVKVRNPGPDRHEILQDGEWLRNAYVNEQKSANDIAKEIGASGRVVNSWLHRHKIEPRRVGVHKPYVRTDWHRKRMSESSKRFVGKNNPNYKGGPDRLNMALRTSYKSKEWARLVKERDNHTCCDCGVKNVLLHAHHLMPWKTHEDLRFDVSNGVTVCIPCHEKRHGRKFRTWVHKVGKITTSTNPL